MASESEASYKRKKLAPNNLCVICFCYDGYDIFIVDVNRRGGGGEEFIKTQPNLRVRDFKIGCYFCVLGSTLYIFDAPEVYEYRIDDKQSQSQSNLVVKNSLMIDSSHVADMPSFRFIPNAIPTPDGNILVFSSSHYFFYPDCLDEDDLAENYFGLFDPISRSWRKLPQLCVRLNDDNVFEMRTGFNAWVQIMPRRPCKPSHYYDNHPMGYNPMGEIFEVTIACFTSKHTVLVHIASLELGLGGQYVTIDLESLEKGWQLYHGWIPCRDHVSLNDLLVVEDRLFVSCMEGYFRTRETDAVAELVRPPPSGFGKIPTTGGISKAIVLSDYVEDEECSFCILRCGTSIDFGTDKESAYLIVDVFNSDLSSLSKASLKTSFKFHVAEACYEYTITNGFMLSSTPFPFPFSSRSRANEAQEYD